MKTVIKPPQKTSLKQKTKNENEELKRTIDFFIGSVTEFYTTRNKFWKLYQLANGIFPQEYYDYVTNPMNSTKEKHRKFPAKIRNYDIINPTMRLLQGEKTKRPFPYQVFVHNEDSFIQKREEVNQKVNGVVQQMFINELNNQGMETGMDTQEVQYPEKVREELERTWVDKRSKWGQHALHYISDDQDINDKWEDMFFDSMVCDHCFSYKDVSNNDVFYEYISPFEISYVAGPNVKMIENGEAAIRRTTMSVSELIDRFGDLMTDEQIDKYETSHKTTITDFVQPNDFWRRFDTNSRPNKSIEVVHVTFKSLRKIGRVMRFSVLGELEEFEVDELYVPSDDEVVEWRWINQVFEGYKVNDEDYIGIQMIPNLRGSFENPSECKLPYNGLCFANRNSESISLIERMMPFQILYNIVHYRLELTLAKNKDKLTLMPLGLIPDTEGMDMFDAMYYSDSTGYLFFDETKKNAIQSLQYVKTLDAGLSQSIKFAADFLKEIKNNLEEFLGISRQRKGQITSSDGLGNSERAIFQSSIITEIIFSKFDKFQQKEMQGFLDLSRHAWKRGKKGQYINSMMELEMFEVPEEMYANSELGVFVKISAKEQEKLQELKALAQPFAQNGVKPSLIADIISSDNFQYLKSKLERFEKEMEEKQQAAAQQEQEMQMNIEQIRAQETEAQRMFEIDKQDKELGFRREELYAKISADLNSIDPEQARRQYELSLKQLSEEERSNRANETLKEKELRIKKETELKKIAKMGQNRKS